MAFSLNYRMSNKRSKRTIWLQQHFGLLRGHVAMIVAVAVAVAGAGAGAVAAPAAGASLCPPLLRCFFRHYRPI